jgi:DNA-binding SARP family transcriptional activator
VHACRTLAASCKRLRHDVDVAVVVRILGPVVIESSSGPCAALGPKPRMVLAVLAAHRGSVVSTDRLRDALWGDAQPPSASATLQSHVSRVRRLLAHHGEIVGLDRGYRLDLPDGGIDIDEFERLARLANDSTDLAEAITLYTSALACWRGPAFGDLADHEWLQAESVRLDELRLAHTEEWLKCRLAAGGDSSLLGDLERLAITNPLRERPRGGGGGWGGGVGPCAPPPPPPPPRRRVPVSSARWHGARPVAGFPGGRDPDPRRRPGFTA